MTRHHAFQDEPPWTADLNLSWTEKAQIGIGSVVLFLGLLLFLCLLFLAGITEPVG